MTIRVKSLLVDGAGFASLYVPYRIFRELEEVHGWEWGLIAILPILVAINLAWRWALRRVA